MTIGSDHWTCPHPGCPEPRLVVVGAAGDTAEAIAAVEQRHAREHRRSLARSAR